MPVSTKAFVIECDASKTTISTTLNQQAGRPVAFMSLTPRRSELYYSVKKSIAIIDSFLKFSDLLVRRHFGRWFVFVLLC